MRLFKICFYLLFFQFGFGVEQETQTKPTYRRMGRLPFGSTLRLGGFYQTRSKIFAEADVFLPLLFSNDTIVFVDLRGLDFKALAVEGNAGLGLRHLINQKYLLGLYGFYDRKRSKLGNLFNQITIGAEFKTVYWSLIFNGYIPFGTLSYKAAEFDRFELVDSELSGFKNLALVDGRETAMYGVDGDLGRLTYGALTFWAGFFYFWQKDVPTLWGPKVRLTFQVTNHSQRHRIFDYILFEFGGRYDRHRNWQVYGGLRFNFDIGAKKPRKLSPIQKRMTEYVRRDLDIVTFGNLDAPLEIHRKTDGTPVEIKLVFSEADLASGIAMGDVLALRHAVTLTGTHTLMDDQVITGLNYFVDGLPFAIANSGKLILAGANPILQVGQNNIVRDMCFQVDPGTVAVTNIGTASFGTLLVDSIGSNGEFQFSIDGSTGSNLTFINNEFDMGDVSNARCLQLIIEEGLVTVPQINNNQFTFGSGSNNIAIYNNLEPSLLTAQTMTLDIDQIYKNEFTFGAGDANIGVFNEANATNSDDAGEVQINQFTDNTMTFVNNTNARGMFNQYQSVVHTGTGLHGFDIEHFSRNKIHFEGGSGNTALYNFTSAVFTSTDIGTMFAFIEDNTFSFSSGDNHRGIHNQQTTVINAVSNELTIENFIGNTVEFGPGDNNYGFYSQNLSTLAGNHDEFINNLANNTFTFASGNTNRAIFLTNTEVLFFATGDIDTQVEALIDNRIEFGPGTGNIGVFLFLEGTGPANATIDVGTPAANHGFFGNAISFDTVDVTNVGIALSAVGTGDTMAIKVNDGGNGLDVANDTNLQLVETVPGSIVITP